MRIYPERATQKMKHFFFHRTQAFHFCHKTVNRFCEILEQIKISQLIMSDQMEKPCIALKIRAKIYFPVNDLVKILYSLFIFASTEIKTSDLVIKYQDAMPVNIKFEFLQLFFNVWHLFQSF